MSQVGELAIQFVAGIVAGVFAGLTGAGGGVLLVPVLMLLGLPPLSATAASSAAISVSALSGTWTNVRRFGVPLRRIATLAIPAVILAPLGVALAHQLPTKVLLLSFATFNLIAIGLLQFRLRPPSPAGEGRSGSGPGVGSGAAAGEVASETGEVTPVVGPPEDAPGEAAPTDVGASLPPASLPPILATGSAGGVLAGMFGVGGGLIMVPLQAMLLNTPVRLASRISLGVVLFASVTAVLGHLWQGGEVRWLTALAIAAGGLIGAPIGARWLHRFTDLQSTRMLQVTLFLVAVSFIWRAL